MRVFSRRNDTAVQRPGEASSLQFRVGRSGRSLELRDDDSRVVALAVADVAVHDEAGHLPSIEGSREWLRFSVGIERHPCTPRAEQAVETSVRSMAIPRASTMTEAPSRRTLDQTDRRPKQSCPSGPGATANGRKRH